ncbi:cardiolipin synthase [Anaerosinus massiliensis]|uniref:cardiolipin synthase n=1 Tax=Massilibacillus massiliensis TaxID=1806837 RepID=UPI000ADCD2A9|nr:cardiolipin synthase [Massilibacillus massiliensis]
MDGFNINIWFMLIIGANFIFVVFTLCIERKNPTLALSWILTLTFLPVVGFILYLMFGTNMLIRKKKTLDDKRQQDDAYRKRVMEKIEERDAANKFKEEVRIEKAYQEFIQLNLNIGNSPYTTDNDVDIFITAKDKYRQLILDIEKAETSIHMLYFIIRNDRIGRLIIEILSRKARAGVKVRLLYDHAGCMLTPMHTFKPLIESGAEVERFFPVHVGNYLRINFRNHRKIVVIDGKIGYLGGMNIGDEYMGLLAENSPWRDTHLRIEGSSVYLLQMRFIDDWNFATHYRFQQQFDDIAAFFPPFEKPGSTKLQIVSSGPDTMEEEIKWNFVKLLYTAKEYIYIQTPYFVPDDSFLEALKIAAMSGIKVKIMVPSKTDNIVVHKVSISYLGELLSYGIEIFFYPGFLHAKMLLIDEEITSIGSANMDIRSFTLNFEVNAFMYGKEISKRCADIFRNDLKMASKFTLEDYTNRSRYIKMQESAFRLVAPLL